MIARDRQRARWYAHDSNRSPLAYDRALVPHPLYGSWSEPRTEPHEMTIPPGFGFDVMLHAQAHRFRDVSTVPYAVAASVCRAAYQDGRRTLVTVADLNELTETAMLHHLEIPR